MKNFYKIIEDLVNFMNVNIIIVDMNNFKISGEYSFNISPTYVLTTKEIVKFSNLLHEHHHIFYVIKASLEIGYFILKKENFMIIIGPILLDNNIDNNTIYQIQKNRDEYNFYLDIKKVKITSIKLAFKFFNKIFNNNYQNINYHIINRNIKIKNQNSISNSIKIQENILVKRYTYENLLLDNIKKGNVEQAKFYLNKLLEHFDFSVRLPFENLRANKNGIFILAGIIRKSVEDIKVPLTEINLLSSKIFYMIENIDSKKEMIKVCNFMIEEYSLLCLHQTSIKHHSTLIDNAIFFININLKKNITVTDVAKYCNVSIEHLSRKFKLVKKITLKKYIINLKIEHSLIELKNPSYKIKEIAMIYDFSSSEIYSKHFKKLFKLSPMIYRKNSLPK